MNSRLAKQKAKDDMALNLSELAIVSGYTAPVLRRMNLPLIEGKISLRDFWRVLRNRQELGEKYRNRLVLVVHDGDHGEISEFNVPPEFIEASSLSEAAHSTQAAADKFRAPRSSNGQPSASPSPAAHRARNIE
jgi:hypothetical protein